MYTIEVKFDFLQKCRLTLSKFKKKPKTELIKKNECRR